MDVASIAAAFIAAQASQVQTAMAAKMLRMNADQANNAVKLLEAGAGQHEQPRQCRGGPRRQPRYFGMSMIPKKPRT